LTRIHKSEGYEGIWEAATLEAAAAADSWTCTKEVKSAIKMERRTRRMKMMAERMTAARDRICDKRIGDGERIIYLGGRVDSAWALELSWRRGDYN
jgi:hypothetical protein